MRTPNRWLPAAAAVAVAAWGANQFTALATVYRARTDWSALALAAMFSVYLVGLVPGLLLGGPAADRYGRRRVVRGALGLSAAASALLAVTDEPTGYVARLATGFAAGLVFLAGTTWLRELSRPSVAPVASARRAMYATGVGFAAGALASGVLAQWLPDPTVLPCLAHAAACLLVLWATRRLPDTAAARRPAPPGEHHRAAVRHPRFRYVVLPASPAVLGAATVAYVVLPPPRPVRIIAGSAKGVRLTRVPEGTRPLSDMAREGLFASLGDIVEGARCLDLFAGTGATGIEALSRGADAATFVDRSAAAVSAVRENLRRTGFEAAATVVRASVERWISRTPAEQNLFDIVLCDPPYDLGGAALGALLVSLDLGWLAPEGWTVVVTRGHKSSPVEVPVHWAVRRQLRYGDSLLTQYREERWA